MGVGKTQIGLVFIACYPSLRHIDQHEYPPAVEQGTRRLVGTFHPVGADKFIGKGEYVPVLGYPVLFTHNAEDFFGVFPDIGGIAGNGNRPVVSGVDRRLVNQLVELRFPDSVFRGGNAVKDFFDTMPGNDAPAGKQKVMLPYFVSHNYLLMDKPSPWTARMGARRKTFTEDNI
jgi:hypothetical protein